MRTAKAKDLSQTICLFKHALRNAILPVVTYMGPMVAYTLVGSFIVEKIFRIPGLGGQFVSSITNRDYTVIMGTTIFLATLVIVMNLIVDIIYKIIDPRIELKCRAGNYDISRNGWVCDYDDPSNMLELFISTNGNNDGKYNNPAYDDLMAKAANETNPEKRFEYLHQAEDLLMEDAACIPVAYYSDFYLQSDKITGSWHSPYGYWYFMFADIAD